jgi:hypothetical protein
MKQMKTLTVNGTTYAVTDPTAPRIDDAVVGDAPWSAKKIVDTLCPGFTETGSIVTCTPVAGYPLEVTADSAVTRCGRNLFDKRYDKMHSVSFIDSNGNPSKTYWGYEFILPPGSYTLRSYPAGTYNEGYLYGAVTNLDGKYVQFWPAAYGPDLSARPATFTEWVKVIIYEAATPFEMAGSQGSSWAWFSRFNVQLEVGNTATTFEPYNGETFAPGDAVPALPGVNTLWAENGQITVTGRAVPAYAAAEAGGEKDGI